MAKKKKKKKDGSGFFWKLLFIIALSVFIFSGYQLFTIYQGYKAGVDEYDAVAKNVVMKSEEPLVAVEQKTAEDGTVILFEEATYQPPEVNFEELQQMNPDVIGWIEIEALPEISYPIVQGDDNDYYLHNTFKKTSNNAGSIFVDYRNGSNFIDCNTIIYGHNMKNMSMFGSLKKYKTDGFYEENQYFTIYTNDMAYRYQIFSYRDVSEISSVYSVGFGAGEQFQEFVNDMIRQSYMDTDVSVTGTDKVVTLSTCSSEGNRFVVHAVMVDAKPYE